MVNLGNDATISTTPLLNIFISGESLPVAVLELVDYQDHLADGEKEYGTFICHIFLEHMKKNDPDKSMTDIVMFDKYSNI